MEEVTPEQVVDIIHDNHPVESKPWFREWLLKYERKIRVDEEIKTLRDLAGAARDASLDSVPLRNLEWLANVIEAGAKARGDR